MPMGSRGSCPPRNPERPALHEFAFAARGNPPAIGTRTPQIWAERSGGRTGGRTVAMDHTEQVSKSPGGGAVRRRAALAVVLWAALLAVEAAGQPGGLFLEAAPVPDAIGRLSPEATDLLALRSRPVRIDFAQLASPDVAVAARCRRRFGRGARFGSARVRRVAPLEPVRRHGVHGRGRANGADLFWGLCGLGPIGPAWRWAL